MKAVVHLERLAGGVDEPQVALVVVGEREVVVAALEEVVRLRRRVVERAAQLGAPALPGVVGVGMAASLPLGGPQGGGVVGGHRLVVVVGVEVGARLRGVGQRRVPPEVVVEGPVLHAQDNEVVEIARAAAQARDGGLGLGGLGEQPVGGQQRGAGQPGGVGGAAQEVAPAQRPLGIRRVLALLRLQSFPGFPIQHVDVTPSRR